MHGVTAATVPQTQLVTGETHKTACAIVPGVGDSREGETGGQRTRIGRPCRHLTDFRRLKAVLGGRLVECEKSWSNRVLTGSNPPPAVDTRSHTTPARVRSATKPANPRSGECGFDIASAVFSRQGV